MSFDIERVPSDEVLPGDGGDRWLYVWPDPRQPLVRLDLDKATSSHAKAHASAGIPRRLDAADLPDCPELAHSDIDDLEA